MFYQIGTGGFHFVAPPSPELGMGIAPANGFYQVGTV
jgi:hypothetical protein